MSRMPRADLPDCWGRLERERRRLVPFLPSVSVSQPALPWGRLTTSALSRLAPFIAAVTRGGSVGNGTQRIVCKVRIAFGGAGLFLPEHLADHKQGVAVGDGKDAKECRRSWMRRPGSVARSRMRPQSFVGRCSGLPPWQRAGEFGATR